MKFLIFFILFLNTKNFNIDGLRLPTAEFIELIEEVEKNGSFYNNIKTEYRSNVFRSNDNNNILKAFQKTHGYVEMLKKIFVNAVIKYISNYLISYCTKVIELIDHMKNDEDINEKFIDDIKVTQDHGYCMVVFLYNSDADNADIQTIHQVMVFLDTYFNGDILERKYMYLRRKLVECINLLTNFDYRENLPNDNVGNSFSKRNWYFKIDSDKTIFFKKIEPRDSESQRLENIDLGDLKNIFTAFSNKFCVSTVPKILDLIYYGEYEYEHWFHPIVLFTIEDEGCNITDQMYEVDKLAMQYTIFEWNCTNIMTTPEYGKMEYLEEIQIDSDAIKNKTNDTTTSIPTNKKIDSDSERNGNDNTTTSISTNKKIDKYKKKLSNIVKIRKRAKDRENQNSSIEGSRTANANVSKIKTTTEIAIQLETSKNELKIKMSKDVFTLYEIRYNLKSFYFDAVNYNNIMSEVIILVSIKEGEKIMDLIKNVFWRRYNIPDHTLTNAYEIFKMRQQLIIFKIFFDKLADKILEKLFINVNENTAKKLFDTKVEQMLKCLDSSGYKTHDEFENSAHIKIQSLVGSGENVPFANQFYFDEFFFVSPLTHVYELIYFIDNLI